MTHHKSRKTQSAPLPGRISIHNQSRKIKSAPLPERMVYQDGDVAIYLLQLLGTFDRNDIKNNYIKSHGNFFKFFKKLIESRGMNGGGGKRKSNAFEPGSNKVQNTGQNYMLDDIIKKFNELKETVKTFNDAKSFEKKLDIVENRRGNPEIHAQNLEKLKNYKNDLEGLSNLINEIKKCMEKFDERFDEELSYIHLCKTKGIRIPGEKQIETLYNIIDLQELIDTFIHVLKNEIEGNHSRVDIEIILNRVQVVSLFFVEDRTFNKFRIRRENVKLDKDQIDIVNRIGVLIRDIATLIEPSTDTKLYDICRTGSNIEEKIKKFVLENYPQTALQSTSSDQGKAIIINNGSNKFSKYTDNDKNLKDYCIYTNACRIDAGSHECNIKEDGPMDLKISCNSSTSASTPDYIDISLKKKGTKFDLEFKFKLEKLKSEPYDYTYKDNEITLQKVYIEVLKLFLKRIAENNFTWPTIKKSEDADFIGNFIATYSIKTLGDFLQEVNAGIKGGGYTEQPTYSLVSSDIQPKEIILDSDVDRIYMVNDKLSYCRFLAMKSLFPDTDTNKNSYAILDTAGISIDKINPVLQHYSIPTIIYK